MRFDVSPYQITLDGMEIYCEETVDLHPGDVLRFDVEGGSGKPVYGVVADVRAEAKTLGDEMLQAVTVDVLYGTPGFNMGVAERLREDQMGDALLALQKEIQHPLQLTDHFTGEFLNLDTLTLIEGPSFSEKYEALLMLMNAIQPYQRLVVIDPIGVFSPSDGVVVLSAAHDVQLSLADVGMKRVLAGIAEALPESLQASATQYLSGFLADAQEFMAFDTLLNRVRMDGGHPAAQAILETLDRQSVFANERTQALSLQTLQQEDTADGGTIALDISSLPEPWKTLFYEEAIGELLLDAGGDVVPVLIYPENYLKQLPQIVRKADEADLTMLVLASPYIREEIEDMADNRFVTGRDNKLYLSGSLTYGLPVCLTMTGESGTLLSGFDSEADVLGEELEAVASDAYDNLPRTDFEGLTIGEEISSAMVPPQPEPIDVSSDEPLTIGAGEDMWQPPALTGEAFEGEPEPTYTPDALPDDETLPRMSVEEVGEGSAKPAAAGLPKPESRSVHTMFDDDDAWKVPDNSEASRLGDFDSILGTAEELPKTDYDILPPPTQQPFNAPEDWGTPASTSEEGEFDSILGDIPDMPAFEEEPAYSEPALPGFEPISEHPYESPEKAGDEGFAPPEIPPVLDADPALLPEEPVLQELPPELSEPGGQPNWQDAATVEDEFEFDISLADEDAPADTAPETGGAFPPDMPVPVEPPPLQASPPALPDMPVMPSPEAPPLQPLTLEFNDAPDASGLPADMPLPPPLPEPSAGLPADMPLPPPLPEPSAGLPADMPLPPPLPEPSAGLPADMPPMSILEQRVETDPSLWEQPSYYQPPPAPMPGLPADMPLPPPLPEPSAGLPADMPLPPPLPEPVLGTEEEEFSFPDETAVLMPPDQALEPLRIEPELTPLGGENVPGIPGPPPDSEGLPVIQRHEAEEPDEAEKPGFKPGDQVRHDEYGVGIINKIIPMEGSVVLNITFEHVGKRLMDPALSELQKI